MSVISFFCRCLLFQQFHYRLWRKACLDDGTQTVTHILDRGAEEPHGIIDDEAAVVYLMGKLNEVYLRALAVVLLEIEYGLLAVAFPPSAAVSKDSLHTAIFCNSPSLKMLLTCRVILLLVCLIPLCKVP